jgi:hypothetical protein
MRLTEDQDVGSQLLRNQHAASCVLEFDLRDRPLFLAGLAYWHATTYHWVTAVVTRDSSRPAPGPTGSPPARPAAASQPASPGVRV